MSLPEFRKLASKAAVILEIKDPSPGKAWLLQHCGTANPSELSDEQYEDAICRLREIVNGSGTSRQRAGSAPIGRPQAGAQPPLATPDAIAGINAAFERLGYSPDERPARIRAFTGGRTNRSQELTEYEIQALLDELRPDRLAPV